MGRSGRVGGSGGEQPFPEARHVDSGEPGAGRRCRCRAGPRRRAVRPAGPDDPARQAGRTAGRARPTCGGCWTACSTSCAPAASGATCRPLPLSRPGGRCTALHARLRGRGRVGDDPPPSGDDAARAGRPRAEPHGGHPRHPERQDDGQGGPRGYDAAKRLKGRKRHLAVGTSRSAPRACCRA